MPTAAPQTKDPVMATGIYAVLLLACSSALCVFGYFVGRCARKLPFLDNNLPWTLRRGQLPPEDYHTAHEPAAGPPHWPQGSLQGLITAARPSRLTAVAPHRDKNDSGKVRFLQQRHQHRSSRPSEHRGLMCLLVSAYLTDAYARDHNSDPASELSGASLWGVQAAASRAERYATDSLRSVRPGSRPGWSSKERENERSVTSRRRCGQHAHAFSVIRRLKKTVTDLASGHIP
jgi:alkanesulfonate monooxygenase SsuD/methylene tetrahydromethanopterin reductase-like flavin-dependent oxidoreductase (luciferase family)